MKNKTTSVITETHLVHMIIELSNLPRSYSIMTMNKELELKIIPEKGIDLNLRRALMQESLRKRFSQPERILANQRIIKNAGR